MANYRINSTSLVQTNTQIKNKVLKNTYFLLSLSLIFSGLSAFFTMQFNLNPAPNLIVFFLGAYGLMFLVHALRNSALGSVAVFMFTGFMGYTLAPLLNSVLALSNGGNIIIMSLFSTGVIFMGLSGHVLVSKKDYSYLGGMLFIGMMTAILSMLAAFLFNIPALHLAASAAVVLISSGMILFQTSQIINGGERNYLIATIGLYVSLYNIFVSLLHIFSAFSGHRD